MIKLNDIVKDEWGRFCKVIDVDELEGTACLLLIHSPFEAIDPDEDNLGEFVLLSDIED